MLCPKQKQVDVEKLSLPVFELNLGRFGGTNKTNAVVAMSVKNKRFNETNFNPIKENDSCSCLKGIRSKNVNGSVSLFNNFNRYQHEKTIKRDDFANKIPYRNPQQKQNVAQCYIKRRIVPFALLYVLFSF